jgi:hypothetical protein
MAGTRTVDIEPFGERVAAIAEAVARELGENATPGEWAWERGGYTKAPAGDLVVVRGRLGRSIWLGWSDWRAYQIAPWRSRRWPLDTPDETIVAQAVAFVSVTLARVREALAAEAVA